MLTISIASDKGGPGKTTTAILIGAELALDGYTVAIIDTDLNQQAAAFVNKASIPGLTVYADVREDNVLPTLKKAEKAAEIVIIDLPGGSLRSPSRRFAVRTSCSYLHNRTCQT